MVNEPEKLMLVEKLYSFTGHSGSVYSLSDGVHDYAVLSASSDKFIAEWNLDRGGAQEFSVKLPAFAYSILNIKEKGCLYLGLSSGAILQIDVKERRDLRHIKPHLQGVFKLIFVAELNILVSGGGDGKVIFYDADTLDQISSIQLSEKKIRDLLWDSERKLMYVACGDGDVVVMNVVAKTIEARFKSNDLSANCVCLSQSGKILLTGGRDAYINLFSVDEGFKKIHSIPAHNFAVYSILYLEGIGKYASASRDKTIKIWDGKDLNLLVRIDHERFGGHVNSVNTLFWKQDMKLLCSAGDDRSVLVWKFKED